jgi:hypothetical protein
MRVAIALLAAVSLSAQDVGPTAVSNADSPGLAAISSSLCSMYGDADAQARCRAHGLDLLSLTWEDTGRSKASCWGPNISDATIQVLGGGRRPASLGFMPVMRHPNFNDVTCDLPMDHLKILVGNESGSALHPIRLGDYLDAFGTYQHAPTGMIRGSLRRERDQEVLVSAQACLLPVAAGGHTAFAPVLFNYQSGPGRPAVLVILATPEGTSAQVIDDNAQACAGVLHGQRLFHNRNGQRALLSAERFSDHEAAIVGSAAEPAQIHSQEANGLSMVLLIQVPLKRKPMPMRAAPEDAQMGKDCEEPAAAPCCAGTGGMETAVITSGRCDGPWLGLDGCTIERDDAYPIRATVQFYQATDSGELSDADAARIGKAIDRIYVDADAVGSLVVDGVTDRVTEPHPAPAWPAPWWQGPCESYTQKTGEPWSTAIERIQQRLGSDWQPTSARELANALALVAH